jgi:hypothetical protein
VLFNALEDKDVFMSLFHALVIIYRAVIGGEIRDIDFIRNIGELEKKLIFRKL